MKTRYVAALIAGLLLAPGCWGHGGHASDDDNAPTVSAEAWPEADLMFQQDPRWMGGGAGYTVDLGGERVLWLFADSFVATTAARRRSESVIVRNCVGVQQGRDPSTATLSFYWQEPDGPDSAESYFAEPGDRWLWPLHGANLDGRLILFFTRLRATTGGLGFEGVDWQARLVHNPADAPSTWQVEELAAPPNAQNIFLGTSVLVQGDYLIAYGMQEPSHDLYAARWPVADVRQGDLSGLQWWCGGDQWASDCTAGRLLSAVAAELSIHEDPVSGWWLYLESEGFGQTELGVRWARGPLDGWTHLEAVYRPPEYDWPEVFIYAGKAHPELTGADVVATYVANSFDPTTVVNDPAYYYPRFVRFTVD